MTEAITRARRATRKLNHSTVSIGRTLSRRAVRGAVDALRSYASWSQRAWSGLHGPWSTR